MWQAAHHCLASRWPSAVLAGAAMPSERPARSADAASPARVAAARRGEKRKKAVIGAAPDGAPRGRSRAPTRYAAARRWHRAMATSLGVRRLRKAAARTPRTSALPDGISPHDRLRRLTLLLAWGGRSGRPHRPALWPLISTNNTCRTRPDAG